MTTWNDTNAGYGIRCDNKDIYCNSEEYYCDGSVVMKDIGYITTTWNDIGYIGENGWLACISD